MISLGGVLFESAAISAEKTDDRLGGIDWSSFLVRRLLIGRFFRKGELFEDTFCFGLSYNGHFILN